MRTDEKLRHLDYAFICIHASFYGNRSHALNDSQFMHSFSLRLASYVTAYSDRQCARMNVSSGCLYSREYPD